VSVSDHHVQLHAYPDGRQVAPAPTMRLRSLFRHVMTCLETRIAAWSDARCSAVIGFLLLFSPLIDGGTTQVPVLVIRLVLLFSAVIWLLHRMRAGVLLLPHTRLLLVVILFSGWAILSLGWSPYKNASVQWILSILSYTWFFAMVGYGLRSRDQIRSIVLLVTGVGVCEGLFGIAQYVWLGDARARGTFFNPNFFAVYQASVLMVSLGLLLFRAENREPRLLKGWLCGAAIISLSAFVMAQSRGASVALVGALAFLACCRYGKRALALVLVCLLAGLLVPNPLQHRILYVGTQDPFAYTRLDIWKSSLMRIFDHPLGIGVGMFKQGSFHERFPIEGEIVRYRKRPESAHNEYLQMGVELGFAGLGLFLWGAGLWATEIARLLREPDSQIDQGILMGAAAAAFVLLLHAAVDSTFHEPALVVLLVLMGGLVHRLYVWDRPDAVMWRQLGFSYHPLRATCVLAGALLIAVVCAQSALAWLLHDKGKHRAAHDDLEGAFAWYVLASQIDPGTTGYHDSIARTAMQLYRESPKSEWLLRAAEEEAVARKLNPLDGRFAFRAGTLYRLMAAQALTSAQRAEWLGHAGHAFAEAIRLDPYSPFGYFELAQLRLAGGNVEEAIQLLLTATAHEPNFLPGRAMLAELSLKSGIPGDYAQEMRNITAIHSQYAQQVRDEVERQFIDVDLYPLGRAIALEPKP
jgi:hypothetical protein